MNLLSKLLQKRGINKEDDLTLEEKKVFDGYKKVLSNDAITVDDIKKFCESQIKTFENNIADGKTQPTPIQLGSLHVYLKVLKMIEAPLAEREALERHLNQIISE